MATLKNTNIDDTGYLKLPNGTTAQRPSSPSAGYMRFNTTTSYVEVFDGVNWITVGQSSPTVVTDGLILFYDINNIMCWNGAGSTLYDLTSNNHDATLYNSPSYSLNSGYRVLETNGSSSYFEVTTPNLSTTNHTVMVGSRYTTTTASTTNNSRLLNAVGNNWLLGHWYYTVDKHFAEGWITDSGYGDVTDTNWRIYTALGNYSSDTWGFYINNSLVVSNSNGSRGPNGFAFGIRGYSPGEYAPGQMSFLLVYDRLLTSDEMTINFNAFKNRLGL